jgi:hypothetical protein
VTTATELPAALGFRNGATSVHTSRTMMLDELSLVMEQVGADAPVADYRKAVIEENVVGKATQTTRLAAGRLVGAPPYGWPQDAVDAALLVMFNAGLLQARSGNEPIAKNKLDQKNIAATEFRGENITLTTPQLIAIRKLFQAVGLNVQLGQESANAAEFLTIRKQRAEAAGGAPRSRNGPTPHT